MSSYLKCHCEADCDKLGSRPDEPCWGAVNVVDSYLTDDGEENFMHACKGHEPNYDLPPKPYLPESMHPKLGEIKWKFKAGSAGRLS